MGKKTEELRAKAQTALNTLTDLATELADAVAELNKIKAEYQKLSKTPDKLAERGDLSGLAQKAGSKVMDLSVRRYKAEKAYEVAEKALKDFVAKKKATSKTMHSLQQKLSRLKGAFS